LRTLLLVVVWGSMLFTFPSLALQPGTSEATSFRQGDFEAWMKAAGISRDFEFGGTSTGPHPDPDLSAAPPVLHLELRFLTRSFNGTEETGRFVRLLTKYQTDHSTTLPEKIFYEFIHTYAVGRREASLDLRVLEDLYSVYVSPKNSELTVHRGGERGRQSFSVKISLTLPQEQFYIRSGKLAAADSKAISDSVEKIITAYLVDAGQDKGFGRPDIVPEREDGYLGLSVQGVRGLVTGRYWEWIDIELEFHNEVDLPAKQAQWKFACYLNVKYASSPHERAPTDADSDYPTQVTNLRKKLVNQLQKALEGERRS
jgi:hypothetical protein